jgi:hypothetical protein
MQAMSELVARLEQNLLWELLARKCPPRDVAAP